MTIRDKVLKNGFNFFKGFFPQILHGPIFYNASYTSQALTLILNLWQNYKYYKLQILKICKILQYRPKHYKTYSFYDKEEERFRKLTQYFYYDHFVAEKFLSMDGSKYFNLEVTEENTDDTENYIVDFDVGLNLNLCFKSYTSIYSVDRQNKEIIYFNRKFS